MRQSVEIGEGAARGPAVACRVQGLAKSYRTGFWGRRRLAVADVSFSVVRGGVTGLLGHNGAGKTTTLKALLDLVRPDAGRIELLGRDHRDRRARARVGYLPESPCFYDYLTAGELLDFYGRLCEVPARERSRRVDEALALVGMTAHARTPLRKHSKGMLQRVGLAQALLHDPDLLILDEPMSGLDPLGRREVRDLLSDLRARGKTILLSSHIVPDLEALADEVVMLQEGRVAGRHDLRGAASPTFEVWLAALPVAPGAAAILARGAPRPAAGGREGWLVRVADLPQLRVLLALSADEGVTVRAIQSRQTGLEEAFLAALGVTTARGESPARARMAAAEGTGASGSDQPVRSRTAPPAPEPAVAAPEPELVGAGEEAGR